ncbi:uncharacterized protein LOC135710824 [Ochlerotatus camptorhynchus]
MENRLNDKQQCLDYLGDNEELSPAQICKKSSQSIETKLKTLRLRHCCERTVGSALHNEAYARVLRGGSECVRMLSDLLETDALAARLTCEFTEVLVRYDCGQKYSIIHRCDDCKEAYRRWGCTILLPYFATTEEVADMSSMSSSSSSSRDSSSGSGSSSRGSSSSTSNKSVNNKTGNDGDRRATQGKSNANYRGDVPTKQTEPNLNDASKQQLAAKNISITPKSSRRKTQRVRIRPCLDVCQTVEQKCPYMLPGDRAPALPTQYAGEPTFLCRDLNIEETYEQLLKSNSGPAECCYDYCGSNPQAGVCSRCDPLLYEDDDPEEVQAETNMRKESPNTGKSGFANSTHASNSSSISNTISTPSSSSSRRNLLAELRFSSELPPRLATCPSITSATTPSSPSEHCKSSQQLLLQRQQSRTITTKNTLSTDTLPSRSSSSALTATAVTTTAATAASSSAPSLASSSSIIKLTSIKSIYNVYFNNSWSMRLRCLDEFVAWTKILLQLVGL